MLQLMPGSIDALEDILELPAEMLERVCQNWTKGMDHLRRSRGQNLHDFNLSARMKDLC